MYLFVWEATEESNPTARAYSDIHSAWEAFSNLKLAEFPDFVVEVNNEDTAFSLVHEKLSLTLNWSQFIEYADKLLIAYETQVA